VSELGAADAASGSGPAVSAMAGSTPAEQEGFSGILSDLRNCFGFQGEEIPKAVPVTLDNLMAQFPKEMGSANNYDRWMNWHLRNKEGNERRLRLEVNENDEGKVMRELRWFAVDREGLPIPLELDPATAFNPKDDAINKMLSEGEVFFREKAGGAAFASGDRVDYVVRNDILAEIEVTKGSIFYRCASMQSRDSCQCSR